MFNWYRDLRLKKVTVKVKNEDGKLVDEVKETATFRKAENLIGKRHIFYTPCMKHVKQKVTHFEWSFSAFPVSD